jgi:hypothetical protein
MNIKQALKQKNKLVAQIKEQYQIAKDYNSIEKGNPRRFSVIDALAEAENLTKELVELKARIHAANAPVYGKIFEMSELKSTVKELKSIPTVEGKVSGRYGSSVPEEKSVEIDAKTMSNMIKSLEKRIEALQDELDIHNATTTI